MLCLDVNQSHQVCLERATFILYMLMVHFIPGLAELPQEGGLHLYEDILDDVGKSSLFLQHKSIKHSQTRIY